MRSFVTYQQKTLKVQSSAKAQLRFQHITGKFTRGIFLEKKQDSKKLKFLRTYFFESRLKSL
jgi:hypothetical protein